VLNAGDQVPLIPSVEVVGNAGATVPWQTAGIGAKFGTVDGEVTVTGNVVDAAH
jgi:hypothetical protein